MFALSYEDEVARITIDRGSHRNAVPMSDWAKLEKLVRAANTSAAKMTVFASPDCDSFCAGSDLSELEQLSHDRLKRKKFRGAMASVFGAIRATNKPTIALIRGGCFGTGVGLATACDLRIAHPKSHTLWNSIACFSNVAQQVEAAAKGDLIHVTGRVRENSHGEGDDVTYRTELIADTFSILAKSDNDRSAQA